MSEEFGSLRAETLSKDHVFSGLGGRTVEEALSAGLQPKFVWREVCSAFDVPAERR